MSRFELGSVAAFHLAAAVYALALCVWVFLRGEREGGRGPFANAALPAALALVAAALASFDPDWSRYALVLGLLAAAAMPALAATSVAGPGGHDRAVALVYLCAVGLATWTLLGGNSRPASLVFVVMAPAWAATWLLRAAQRARPGLNRARIGFLLFGAAAFASGIIALATARKLAVVAAPFAISSGLTVLAYGLIEGAPAGATQAAFGTIAWTAASALAFIPIYAVVQALRRFAAWSHPAPAAALLVGLFILLSFYFREVQPRIDQLFRRGRPLLRADLDEFAARALDLRTPVELAHDLDNLLLRVAQVRLSALYLRSGDDWIGVSPDGLEVPPLSPPLDPTSPVVRFLVRRRNAIARDDDFGTVSPPPGATFARALCAGLHADAIVPLVHKDELIGLAAVTADGGLGPAELATLARVRSDVSVAALNAALYERARRMSASLEEKVRAREEELRRAAQQLADAERRLVQQEKMSALGLLASGVGHQIGEALNFIGGNLPNLRRYIDTYETLIERHRTALAGAPAAQAPLVVEGQLRLAHVRKDAPALVSAIEEGTRRARAIAADLRRFAAPEDADVRPVDVCERLDATLNLLHGEIKNRARVHRDYPPKALYVSSRGGQLDQVWMNLIVNSLQAIGEKGDLWIRVERDQDTGGEPEVAVTIADSGPGVPRELREKIFEPFFTTKPVGQGTGLGLAISYGIVERHRGRIELLDPPLGEGGAIFKIRLPEARPT